MKKNIITIIITTILIVGIICILLKPYYNVKDRKQAISNFKSSNVSSTPLGWLRVQGTNIDFPIFYYDNVNDIGDPSFDLGWNFENNKKLVNRTVILSHNMKNVSSQPLIGDKNQGRFEQLMAYIYYDFVKENKYIQYTINNKNHIFKIYGVSFQKEENLDLGNINKKEIMEYVNDTKKESYFKFDVDVNENDKLITLITCTRFFGDNKYSFVVDAREVRKIEMKKNYKVQEKNNYKRIKSILKGDN